jgi:four helix bundle protein
MPTHQPEDISERSFRFTCDVYDFCEDLVRLRGLPCRLAYQLFDAAGSVGANRSESTSAYTDKDFAAKNSIALKECKEARFWLRVAAAKSLGNAACREKLLREANELTAIYTVAVRTLKEKAQKSTGADESTDRSSQDPRPHRPVRSYTYVVPSEKSKSKADDRKLRNNQ